MPVRTIAIGATAQRSNLRFNLAGRDKAETRPEVITRHATTKGAAQSRMLLPRQRRFSERIVSSNTSGDTPTQNVFAPCHGRHNQKETAHRSAGCEDLQGHYWPLARRAFHYA